MGSFQKVRFSLEPYDATLKNSFILLNGMGFREIMDFEKKLFKVNNQSDKADREVAKADRAVKRELAKDLEVDEEKLQALYDNYDKLELAARSKGEEIAKLYETYVIDAFVSGSIYDEKTKGQRDMVAEDVLRLSRHVLQEISAAISGRLEKKA